MACLLGYLDDWVYYSMDWHLIAFCRKRKDYRDFRLERIRRLSLKQDTYERDTNFSLQKYHISNFNVSTLPQAYFFTTATNPLIFNS